MTTLKTAVPLDPQIQAEVTALLDGRQPLVIVRHGSHLYGTEHEDSDVDLRVVCLPSEREILLGHSDFAFDNNPKSMPIKAGAADIKIVSLARHLDLLSRFDMGNIEVMYASETDHAVLYRHSLYDDIIALRHRLIPTRNATAMKVVRVNLGRHMPDVHGREKAEDEIARVLEKLQSGANLQTSPELLEELSHLSGCTLLLRTKGQEDRQGFYKTLLKDAPLPPASTLFLRVGDRLIDTRLEKDTLLSNVMTRRSQSSGPASIRDIPSAHVAHAIRIMRQTYQLGSTGQLCFPSHDSDQLRLVREGRLSEHILSDLAYDAYQQVHSVDWSASPFGTDQDKHLTEQLLMNAHRQVITGEIASQ